MKIKTHTANESIELGVKIGKRLSPDSVVCLYGDLGCGKTTIIKGIASNFGIPQRDITSASFTIIAEYPGQVPFYHIDLYRLDSVEDIEETGFFEYIGDSGVCVIEWAEKVQGLIDCTTAIHIKNLAGDNREITVEGIEWNE